MATPYGDRDLWIDGRRTPSGSGTWLESEDPATHEVLGRVPAGSAADVARAVAAADAAADAWRYTSANERADLLHEVVRLSLEHHEELVQLLTR